MPASSRFVRGLVIPAGGLMVVCGLKMLQYTRNGHTAALGFLVASLAALTITICINLVIVVFRFKSPVTLAVVTAIVPLALAIFLLVAAP